MKTSAVLIFTVIMLFFSSPVVLAQDLDEEKEATPTSEVNEEVNPYALFWPVVAGKTSDEPLYFLKDFKEKIQGFFLFGEAKKGEYKIVLATKRLLEAKKLMDANKGSHALKTLKVALRELEQADNKLSLSKEKNIEGFNNVSSEVSNKLSNINKYLQALKIKTNSEYQPILEEMSTVSRTLLEKLQ